MTNLKTLSTAILLTTALATPSFAHTTKHGRADGLTNLRASYNQVVAPAAPQGPVSLTNPGFDERDPSRVGGFDPSRHAGGN
jgi:hypothetical protein